jgi:spore germination cell wall hydrolase CwlJ-like protein
MNHDFFGLIRVTLLILLILTFVGCCVVEAEPATIPTTIPTEPTSPTKPTILPTYIELTETTEPPTVATEAPTEPETIPTETEPPYTEEEREMLALVIYQESGGDACSDDTRLKVGTVVMNRIADSRFPDTMYEVITAKAQYGRLYWTGLVWPARATNAGEAHAVQRAYAIAERILLGERALPEGVVFQAEFPQGTEVVAHQDGIYFCR